MEGDIDAKTRMKIRQNFVTLCSEIDNIGVSLLLYQRPVLTNNEFDLIIDRIDRRERNIRLMQILLRKNQQQFVIFCECLLETGRGDLKKIIHQ